MSPQYGYYFFLGRKVDAKLYAQTDTSNQAVPLLLRRMSTRSEKRAAGERDFFPLTGISYVVVKVSPGQTISGQERSRRQIDEDRQRLEQILNMNQAINALAARVLQ